MTSDPTPEPCGCDLSGSLPPAVHIVDRHPDPTPYTPTDEDMRRALTAQALVTPQAWERYLSRVRAEAVAPVLALHRKVPIYDVAAYCETPDDENHADTRHIEVGVGELVCMDLEEGPVCESCRDEDGQFEDYPCPTVRAVSIERERRACDECPETTEVHRYGTAHLCRSCHHDAVRSGWTPGGGS